MLTQLKFLNLSYNKITIIEGIDALTSLQTLNLSHNLIEQLTSSVFTKLGSLLSLYLNNNKISDTQEIKALASLKQLTTLNMKDNEVVNNQNYRVQVSQCIPSL